MGHYTSRPLTTERIGSLDRAAMVSFYRERFSNAADFSFFMVGAFKVDEVLPLITRYVGSLPSTKTATSRFKDVGISFPPTIERARVEKGKEPKSQTVVSYFADPPIEENEQTTGRGGHRSARDRAARHPARGAGRNLQRLGGPVSTDAAARRRPHRHLVQRFTGQRRQDDRPRATGSVTTAERRPQRGSDESRQGDGPTDARDVGQAEWLLARPAAIGEVARPRSAPHSQPPAAD